MQAVPHPLLQHFCEPVQLVSSVQPCTQIPTTSSATAGQSPDFSVMVGGGSGATGKCNQNSNTNRNHSRVETNQISCNL